ncbi:ADP-ribosylation factor-like protein 9 [Latimeria chalumnae]|uniref:ADP-ribosylation factor-like protein 9 n=1 Tax=Latimeria chalumnae TaxID=7897 RepID=UPI0003C15F23|nr:PREDICTED: ADP-ribosylation factor-like protein 10 [Latimeria chalumnae]|eukprot:XP_005993447.1 PREDICTED: ADP-ribosylation factor-like protein 10 [Latimeria chalumnae]
MAPFWYISRIIGAAVAALGSVIFIAWKYYFFRGRRYWPMSKRTIIKKYSHDKQILVLGLDGAGKSSILHCISTNTVKYSMAPTQGFNTVYITVDGCKLDFMEIGGSQNLRTYWNLYLSKAQVLIFVVDSTDHVRMPLAKQELHRLLNEEPQLPLVVLANKQDQKKALGISELHKELALYTINDERKFFFMATHITQDEPHVPKNILDFKELLIQLLS